ncbi:MAG: NAD(P)H-dependent oxidoreductase [Labilibaculum sp.]|nr:NAD(P)H-dependent oxidoreductase [Labilibaculum sp.]MBI9060024.1 NAD(P)H-dependent oxidoreductase [Labilibaculum sp.]
MKKIIAFAGSNSSNSINQQLVNYIATLTDQVELIKLTDYDAPIYNIDLETQDGIPDSINRLAEKLAEADQLIISVAEHNGNLSAFFKNILDWLSRKDNQFLKNKDIFLFSTSPGKTGAASALKITETTLPFFGATINSATSIGSFFDVFKDGKISEEEIIKEIEQVLNNRKTN